MGSRPDPKRSFALSGRVIACVAAAVAFGGIVCVGFVAPAQAAVVSYEGAILGFRAHAGEANDVTVEYGPGQATITDLGVPLEAGTGCEQIDVSTALCGSGAYDWFDLGDGADTIRFIGPPRDAELDVYTGAGDDTVRAGAFRASRDGTFNVETGGGNDTIVGGPSAGFLSAGRGDDTVRGGPGSDYIRGGKGNDALYGGRGHDTVDYSFAPRGVSVNLMTERARGWGRDRLRGFEVVEGSSFADVLIGDERWNILEGWGGNDRIHGRRGQDSLYGHWGDDVLFARDGRRDFVRGGSGSDSACVDRRVDRVFSIARFSCQL